MAYGARLESGLGSRPRGFESPILRKMPRFSVERRGFFVAISRFIVGVAGKCRNPPIPSERVRKPNEKSPYGSQ